MTGDTPAAPQAARTSLDKDALARLRYGWGDAYRIGRDDTRGWWARRRDNIGGDLTAADAGRLWDAILKDYIAHPVPRDTGASPKALT
jgi:hypothetical protein